MSDFISILVKGFKNSSYFIPNTEIMPNKSSCITLISSAPSEFAVMEIYEEEIINADRVIEIYQSTFEHELHKSYIFNGNNALARIVICKSIDKNEKGKVKEYIGKCQGNKKVTLVLVILDDIEIIFDDTVLHFQGSVLTVLKDSIYKYSQGIIYHAFMIARRKSNFRMQNYFEKQIWVPFFVKYLIKKLIIFLFITLTVADFIMVDTDIASAIFIYNTISLLFAYISIYYLDFDGFKDRNIFHYKFPAFCIIFFILAMSITTTKSIDILRAPDIKDVVVVDTYKDFSKGRYALVLVDDRLLSFNRYGESMSVGEFCRVKIYPNLGAIKNETTAKKWGALPNTSHFKGLSKEKIIELFGNPFKYKEYYNSREAAIFKYQKEHVKLVCVFNSKGFVESSFTISDDLFNKKFLK